MNSNQNTYRIFYGTGQIYSKVHLGKEMYKSSQENYEKEKQCDKEKMVVYVVLGPIRYKNIL